MPKMELDPHKIYKMPKKVFVRKIDDCYLAISSETANWVLLQNDQQLQIYQMLADGKSVLEAINTIDKNMQPDLYHVLVELEAKRFECVKVNYPQDQGMYIYLTNRCNQRCRHCYMYAGKEMDHELTTEELQKILHGFALGGGKVVTFTGGEATLRKDFKTIVTSAKREGLMVGVLSNGTMWPAEWKQWVKEAIDEVQISIDGFDKDSYQCVRGMDSFQTALDTVDWLVSAGVRVTVSITPLLETLISNESKYIEFADYLLEKYRDKPFFVKFNTELMDGRMINPTEAENERYRKSIKQIEVACKPYSEEQGFAMDHIHNTVFNNCGYGGLTIASNGDIYFCNLIECCAKQGNVRDMSFDDIMFISQKARELSDINNLIPCNNCDLKYICGGGCRVKNFKRLVELQIDKETSKESFTREKVCTQDYKERMYRLMVRANALMYQ